MHLVMHHLLNELCYCYCIRKQNKTRHSIYLVSARLATNSNFHLLSHKLIIIRFCYLREKVCTTFLQKEKRQTNMLLVSQFLFCCFVALLSSALIGGRRNSPALVLIPTGKFPFPARRPERSSGEETVETLEHF